MRWLKLIWFCAAMVFGADAFAQGTNAAATPTTISNAPTNEVRVLHLSDETKAQLTFGLDKVPALQRKVLGFELWQYLASIIYIALAFLVSRFLDYVVSHQLKQWAAKTKTTIDDILIELAHGPIKLVSFVVFLHIGLQFYQWPHWIEVWIARALHLVVAWSLTYMLLRLVDVLVEHWRNRSLAREERSVNEQLFPIISKTAKVFLVVIAALLVSQNLGLDITSILASLSIGGLALGLAAQDTVANLFGAVAVFADKPFQIGDTIKLDQLEGKVETIGLRSTRVRNPDGHLITVPNKTMGNATIINITRRPTIRTVMDIGLPYDTSPAKVRRAVALLTEIYKGHPKTTDLIVSFNQFAASALNIKVIHWWNGSDYKEYMAGIQDLNLAVQERFEVEQIQFAFPTQTVMLRQDSPWRMEAPAVEFREERK